MDQNSISTELRGITTRFKGNGRKLGYPTANINAPVSSKDGVYFGFATMGPYNHHPALIFIGTPVTIGDKTRRIEAHLLDITDKDYYNMPLQLFIKKFHRPNQKFESIKQLLIAMKADEAAARNWFSLHEKNL